MNKVSEEIDWKEEGRRFDRVAEFYAAYRPGYPDELIECVISLTGIHNSGKILEVGSGTGIATALFARCLFQDLGNRLAMKLTSGNNG